MDIDFGTMSAMTARINLSFNKYIPTVETHWQKFCMKVPSTTGENVYPRIAELPGMREWLGERIVHRISAKERFTIVNKTFEQTFALRREDIEDDQYGFLTPCVEQLAADAAGLPDLLAFDLLQEGHRTLGIDGQYYFDSDHAGSDRNGKPTTFSNILRPGDSGSSEQTSPAWFLFCTKNPMKPMIYQTRREFVIQPRTQLTSGVVFTQNEFQWGTSGRCNVGYGLHNYALRSTAPLTADNLGIAIAMLENQYRQDGKPYKSRPNILFVPTSLEGAAQQLVKKDLIPTKAPDGKTWITGSNPWSGTLDLCVCPYLDPIARND